MSEARTAGAGGSPGPPGRIVRPRKWGSTRYDRPRARRGSPGAGRGANRPPPPSRRASGGRGGARSAPPPVVDFDPGQAPAVLLEVADLDQGRPQLDRPLDHRHHVVHDPQQVLLAEVRLEPVESL